MIKSMLPIVWNRAPWLAAVGAVCVAASLSALPQASQAQAPRAGADQQSSEPLPAAVVSRINEALAPVAGGRKLDEVRRSPVPGILEARIANELLYVDEKGRYIFLNGDLIDLQTKRNLSQERVDDLMAIRFDDLPFDLSFKQVNGKGSRRIAVFEDPNCGYCKRLRADLVKLDDVTIHTFPVAFLAADSESKARKALCAQDKVKAWNEMMVENKIAENDGSCTVPLAQTRELMQKLGITGTPVTFFENGKRLVGYAPAPRFGQLLADYSAKK